MRLIDGMTIFHVSKQCDDFVESKEDRQSLENYFFKQSDEELRVGSRIPSAYWVPRHLRLSG